MPDEPLDMEAAGFPEPDGPHPIAGLSVDAGVTTARTSIHYAIAYGGDDPNDCAAVLEYDDQAEAAEMTQWIRDGYVAWCTVTRSRWQREDILPADEAAIGDLVIIRREDLREVLERCVDGPAGSAADAFRRLAAAAGVQ